MSQHHRSHFFVMAGGFALFVALFVIFNQDNRPTALLPLETAPSTSSTLTVIEPTPVSTSTPARSATATSSHALSLPSLFAKPFSGSEFKVGRVLEQNDVYTRHYITYKSGELTISGIMNVPKGTGPFPVLILNHGYIDTAIYTNGRGLRREQDHFARAGYIVVHPDYRNHAQSSKDTRDELSVRLGYVEDVINAVVALRAADLPYVDGERVGMLGHSMGGGITLSALVAQPDLIDAAVLYAPVSGDQRKSYERWMSRRPEAAEQIRALYGEPASTPDFWDNVSAETFYNRVTAPVRIFHGTADQDVPLDWSKETKHLLNEAGKDAELVIYPNGPHEFGRDWPDFMRQSTEFFDRSLKSS
jgi:dipeptidyl aminopeptidase/acylaminoacyl peptidase